MGKIKDFFNTNFIMKNDKFGTVLLASSYFFLFATLATLPLFTTRSGFTSITNVLSIITCVCILAYIIFRGKFYINYFVLFTVLFVLYAAITTLIGSKSYSTLKSVFTLYALSMFVFQFSANTKNVHLIGCALLAGLLIFTVVFLIYLLPGVIDVIRRKTQIGRLGEQFGNLNYVGRNFALGSILCTSIAIFKKKKYFFLLIGSVTTGACVLLTGSRGAFIILAIGTIASFYFLFSKKYKWIYIVALFAIVAIFIGLLQLPILADLKKSMERAFNTIVNSGDIDVSSSRRIQMFKDALYFWSKNAIFGYGANSFASLSSYGTYSHNSVSELLCSFGVVGFILFYSPLIVLLFNLDRNYREENLQYLITVVSTFISFLFIGAFFYVLYLEKIMILALSILFCYDFKMNSENSSYISFSFKKDKNTKRINIYTKTDNLNNI